MAKLSGLIGSGKVGLADQKTVDAMPDAPASTNLDSKSKPQPDTNLESKFLPITSIRASVYQVRTAADPEYIEELMASIQVSGVISPIVVRPVGDLFEIVAGHHRFEACRRLGHTSVEVILRELSDADAAKSLASDNFVRKELTDYERYKHAKMLRDHGFCVTGREIATVLKISPSKVSQLETFDKFPPGAKAIMELYPEIMGSDAAYGLKDLVGEEPDLFTEALALVRDGELLQTKVAQWIASRFRSMPLRMPRRQEVKITRPGLTSPIKLTYTDREAKIQSDSINIDQLRRLIEDNLDTLIRSTK